MAGVAGPVLGAGGLGEASRAGAGSTGAVSSVAGVGSGAGDISLDIGGEGMKPPCRSQATARFVSGGN